jgi:hypothetical protein
MDKVFLKTGGKKFPYYVIKKRFFGYLVFYLTKEPKFRKIAKAFLLSR